MKSPLLHPIFACALLLATANQVVESQGIFIPFVHSYLDDFLVFPIVLTIGLAFYRLAFTNYVLTPWHIWPLLAVYIFVFEMYMPSKSAQYTADFFDVFAYLAGIFLFLASINKIPVKN